MEEKNKKSRKALNTIMMIIAVIVILICVPAVFMNGTAFQKALISLGIKSSPNFNDGYLIAQFDDPPGDLLLQLPKDSLYKNAQKALDIRKFSVKKIQFNKLSGIGIDDRLNLCFEFDGMQLNPFGFKNKFSFPVMHVYIKTPDAKVTAGSSGLTVNAKFESDGWNYQVIIDGMHDQARVFDNKGNLLFQGIGLYVNYGYEEGHEPGSNFESEKRPDEAREYITKTKITAALPLKLIGDPAQGEWKYYVTVGLLDVRNASMLYRTEKDSSNIFDYVALQSSGLPMPGSSGKLLLSPLTVNYSKSNK